MAKAFIEFINQDAFDAWEGRQKTRLSLPKQGRDRSGRLVAGKGLTTAYSGSFTHPTLPTVLGVVDERGDAELKSTLTKDQVKLLGYTNWNDKFVL